MSYDDGVALAATLVREACYAIALTGAGISTPSGIPDFRSPSSGLWKKANPFIVASSLGFRLRPKSFYDWVRPLAAKVMAAEPNPAHLALAELEAAGWLKAVVTQNVDGLHQRAGSREVLELHGHFREATCLRCRRAVSTDGLVQDFLASGKVPRCAVCGGVIKPNTVLFGEQLPADTVQATMAHLQRTDLILVAGSSLEVAPAAELPLLVREGGGCVVVVNLTPTCVDPVADVVIHADVVEVLPSIARACARR